MNYINLVSMSKYKINFLQIINRKHKLISIKRYYNYIFSKSELLFSFLIQKS
jgi:hypothetical protein